MTFIQKKIRYYYWLILSFIKKNFRLLFISFAGGFLIIALLVFFFPFINSNFFKKVEELGITGRYNLSNLPTEVLDAISNPLIAINEKGEITPVLAKSFELLNDNKIYRFYLKSDLNWNDNKKFTAADLNFNLKGIETKVVNEYTIEFKLNQPLSTFPTYLTKPVLKDYTVGVAGQYQVKQYIVKNGDLVSLKLDPNKKNLPYKIFKFYDTEDKLLNAYKKANINIFRTSKKNIADFFSSWKNTKITKTTNYNQVLTLFLNTENEFLSEKEVREALINAIPQFDDFGQTASGPINPLSWAYSHNLKKFVFNLDKAQSFFKKKVQNGKPIEINFYTFYDYITTAEQIKENFEKLGLKINLKVLSYLTQDFDMLLTIWNPPTDPDQYYFWHSTQKEGNITNYKNVRVDKLLEDGRKILNIEERKKIYLDFQRIIIDELPAYFIAYPYVYTIEKR